MNDFVETRGIVQDHSVNVEENGFTNETGAKALNAETEATRKTIVEEDGSTVESTAPDKEHQQRNRRKALLATACILFLQMCERISYYSVVANMVLFCTSSLGYDTVDATTISLVFSGCVYLMPVIGGYVSDAWAGRFLTLLISNIFILIGVALIMISAMDLNEWFHNTSGQTGRRIFFIIGLVLAAIGTAGVKANVSPFGAEQIESLGPEMLNSFFNWFYWITAVGSVVAYTGVAYIQQNISFVWGFVAPLSIMLLAVLLYLLAKPLYVTSKPQGSALSEFFSVLRQGLCMRDKSAQQVELTGHSSITEPKGKTVPSTSNQGLLNARLSHGGDYDDTTVNGIVTVIKILPFCALVIMFWAIYSQTQSSFFIQALRMDVRVGSVNIPAAMLSTFTNLSIVLIIPVLDRVVYPFMSKIGLPMTILKRIGIGLLFSILAAIVAAIVEIYRKEYLRVPGGSHIQTLANKNFTASSLSIFTQTPQFVLVGIGEIFTAATTLEAGYTQAPPSLQGLLTGLFYAASGLGNLLTLGIMLIVEKITEKDPWWGNEINDTKMENLMFLLAGLMALDLIIFCAVAVKISQRQVDTSHNDHAEMTDVNDNLK